MCVAQEHNTMSLARARTGGERTNHGATAPLNKTVFTELPKVIQNCSGGVLRHSACHLAKNAQILLESQMEKSFYGKFRWAFKTTSYPTRACGTIVNYSELVNQSDCLKHQDH